MTNLFRALWESNDWSEWATASGTGPKVISERSAMGSSDYGVENDVAAPSAGVSTVESADLGAFTFDEFEFSLRFDPQDASDTYTVQGNKPIVEIKDGGQKIADIYWWDATSGGNDISLRATGYIDGGGGNVVGGPGTSDVSTEVICKVRVKRASSAVASDGEIEIYLDGVSKASDTTLDNYDIWPTAGTPIVNLALTHSSDAGKFYVDSVSVDLPVTYDLTRSAGGIPGSII